MWNWRPSSAVTTTSQSSPPSPTLDPEFLAAVNAREFCYKLHGYEYQVKRLSTNDYRLFIELHNAINHLFRFYHGKGKQGCRPAPTTTTSSSSPTDYPAHIKDIQSRRRSCETDQLIDLAERRLLELVAVNPSRETIRILASRLLEVVKMKKEYQEEEECADDSKEALNSILAEFNKVQALLRYEF
ncbi:hypothetical protein PRZ48_006794 [Zasmidium cellare]|uniref:Uncharacterized protein n=1 Tax=Zasmidium cellare TaxID=395010 RepID=A0ABR0EIF6_ZASCE|nr:hypothetical protein PRZ48_006794 [Zasmidium cellare]